jgi:hypothetical protein
LFWAGESGAETTEAELIARLVTLFLDDAKPVMPPGFFDAPGEKQGGTKQ